MSGPIALDAQSLVRAHALAQQRDRIPFNPRRVAGDFACIEVKSMLDRVPPAKAGSMAGILLITFRCCRAR
jgi:hypothetical protein